MTEQFDNAADTDGVHPVEIAEMRLRLTRGKPGTPLEVAQCQAISDIRTELKLHGVSATPLVRLLLELRSKGTVRFSVAQLADLYIDFRIPEVLSALRDEPNFSGCNPYMLCELFTAGITQLEDELLDYLWMNWNDAGSDSWSGLVISSLGDAGGPKSLEMLEVLHRQFADAARRTRSTLHFTDDGEPSGGNSISSVFDAAIAELRLTRTSKSINQLRSREN